MDLQELEDAVANVKAAKSRLLNREPSVPDEKAVKKIKDWVMNAPNPEAVLHILVRDWESERSQVKK